MVLAISLFKELQVKRFGLHFEKGWRCLPIHEVDHAFCPNSVRFSDLTLSSLGQEKGEQSVWQMWEIIDDVTEGYGQLKKQLVLIQ